MVEHTGGEFVREMMQWHFSPETGSPFWLKRAGTLGFDPLTDVKDFDDLRLFPNVVDELRDVGVHELIPRGYGDGHGAAVYESGGTTGQPKRVMYAAEWQRRSVEWFSERLDSHGVPRNVDWLSAVPSGPHNVGAMAADTALSRGGVNFFIDLDPRWVKKLLAQGRTDVAGAYTDHLIEQVGYILAGQDVGVLFATPPLLERLAHHDDLVELVNRKVRAIIWGGTHMDADTRDLLRDEVFPDATFVGGYGGTMMLGTSVERPGLGRDEPCVFDSFAPYTTFRVVDPDTGEVVPYGERGQVLTHHMSRTALLVNNLERDYATRIAPVDGGFGDAVADVTPVASFGDTTVIEGVY
ncbi:phenazine antibiotic biosynthesis protein [Streptomyces mashuensis]|uniref:Phenazine antibiotic biosynthesis protein n=1 Tax=Streptomyces mashuensis TaxID=33904 RepID=A0A919B4D2_9ACTN|nr:AMP-binding protein [Streptomyces mashuensis]GHF53376.1 phenazine antibiotic biosynthesis protein [Streptomyces mashuensis]